MKASLARQTAISLLLLGCLVLAGERWLAATAGGLADPVSVRAVEPADDLTLRGLRYVTTVGEGGEARLTPDGLGVQWRVERQYVTRLFVVLAAPGQVPAGGLEVQIGEYRFEFTDADLREQWKRSVASDGAALLQVPEDVTTPPSHLPPMSSAVNWSGDLSLAPSPWFALSLGLILCGLYAPLLGLRLRLAGGNGGPARAYLALLAVVAVGGALGVQAGAVAAALRHPTADAEAIRSLYLPEAQQVVAPKPGETSAFHMMFAAAVLGGLLAATWAQRRRAGWQELGRLPLTALAVGALGATAAAMALGVPPTELEPTRIAVLLMLAGVSLVLVRAAPRPTEPDAARPPAEATAPPVTAPRLPRFGWTDAALIAGLFLVLFVPDPSAVAHRWWTIETWHHWSFFALGPGLYRLSARALLPGVDYYSQYGLGPPAVYGLLARLGGPPSPGGLVAFIPILAVLYYYCVYRVFLAVTRRRDWAMTAALLVLILRIAGGSLCTRCPSITFLRSPLDVLTALIIVNPRWGERRSSLLVAALAGIATFWVTDVGLALGFAAAAAIAAWWWCRRIRLWHVLGAVAVYVGVFAALALAAYGPRILDAPNLKAALAPLWQFGGHGLMAVPLFASKSLTQSLVFNVLTPGVLILALALGARQALSRDVAATPLIFWGVYGFFTYHIYLNRSMEDEWFHYALLPAAMALVALLWSRPLRDLFASAGAAQPPRRLTCALIVLGAAVLAISSRSIYFTEVTPGTISWAASSLSREPGAAPASVPEARAVIGYGHVMEPPGVLAQGAAEIARRTPPAEPAFVISTADTEYCRLAQRPPGFYSCPLYQGINTREQLGQACDALRGPSRPTVVFTDLEATEDDQTCRGLYYEFRPGKRPQPELNYALRDDVALPLLAVVRDGYHRAGRVGALDIWERTEAG